MRTYEKQNNILFFKAISGACKVIQYFDGSNESSCLILYSNMELDIPIAPQKTEASHFSRNISLCRTNDHVHVFLTSRLTVGNIHEKKSEKPLEPKI